MPDVREEPRRVTASTVGEIEAAGAVVWRRGANGPDVLLVHRPRRDDWSLAKGKREPGEQLAETAVREVVEETGVRPVLGRHLKTVRYLASGRPKRVEYWAAAEPAPPRVTAGFVPNDEVDELCWCPLSEAYAQLSYADDIGVLDRFARWPHRTVPFVVVRHASAGHKQDWSGDDLLRPLDLRGQQQARALVPLLDCFGPVRVVSSPAARCLATIEPYAAHVGAPVVAEPSLMLPRRPSSDGSDHQVAHPEVVSAVRGLLADGIPTVMCAHRENIPDILAVACQYLDAPPPESPSLPKGSFWVLQAAESMLAGLERYDLSGLGAGAWSSVGWASACASRVAPAGASGLASVRAASGSASAGAASAGAALAGAASSWAVSSWAVSA
jgi:8-oxo-dGTP pyrophosphatase MutT (NUDIX family)/phosphohistidine phosphatase SixA